MKLFLDDIRPAPPGWYRARTAAVAIMHLSGGDVEELSLDHDLDVCVLCEEEAASAEAELRADGVDVDAFLGRLHEAILPAAEAAVFLRALANLAERGDVLIERHDMQTRGILLSLLDPALRRTCTCAGDGRDLENNDGSGHMPWCSARGAERAKGYR